MARIRRAGFRRLPTALKAEAKSKGVTPQQISQWMSLGLNVASMIGKIPIPGQDVAGEEVANLQASQEQIGVDAAAARAAVDERYNQFDSADLDKRVAGSDAGQALSGAKLEREALTKESAAIQLKAQELTNRIKEGGNTEQTALDQTELTRLQSDFERRKKEFDTGFDRAQAEANTQRSQLQSTMLAETERGRRAALGAIDEEERRALAETEAMLVDVKARGERTLRDILIDARQASTPEEQRALLQEVDTLIQPANIGESLGFGMERKKLSAFSSVVKMFPTSNQVDEARVLDIMSKIQNRKDKVDVSERRVSVAESAEERKAPLTKEKVEAAKIDNETRAKKNKKKLKLLDSQISKNLATATHAAQRATDKTEQERIKRLATASANDRQAVATAGKRVNRIHSAITKIDSSLAKPVALASVRDEEAVANMKKNRAKLVNQLVKEEAKLVELQEGLKARTDKILKIKSTKTNPF